MAMRNHLLTTTLIALAAAGLCTPAAAEGKLGEAPDAAASADDKATNAALLAKLL